MQNQKIFDYLKYVVENVPNDWLYLTTHRLDIYDESLAKVQFLEKFESLFDTNNTDKFALEELPTAFDYIRLGHPLSCVLEWAIAKSNNHSADHVISFSSMITPILAVLRKNLLTQRNTRINYIGELPKSFDEDIIRSTYGYNFDLHRVDNAQEMQEFNGSNVLLIAKSEICEFELIDQIDFVINIHEKLGSILFVNGVKNAEYIPEIQHVRRRETIAMTPSNTMFALNSFSTKTPINIAPSTVASDKSKVVNSLNEITGTTSKALVASSGLSMQYAIMMGLIHYANDSHQGKDIKFIVPTNCYGGTNDQARRVAACIAVSYTHLTLPTTPYV